MSEPALPGYPGLGRRNYWDDDADLRAAAEAALPPGELAAAAKRLSAFGALVGGRLGELIETSHLPGNLPTFIEGAVAGERASVVAYCPEQLEARRLLAKAAFAQGELGLVERMALAVLANSAGEGGIGCPFAMTDGLERLLAARGTAKQKAELLPKVRSDDPDWALCGGQFVTERQGGSNVSANETVAKKNADGSWSLTGLKWFCSNPSEAWVTTAKPEGTDVVALFLMRRRNDDGTLNGHKILRLKQVGGTKGKATAEVEYDGARAELIGKPREGLVILVQDVLSVSRRHVAAAALGFMGRALAEAEAFAAWRVAYGRKIGEFPAAKAKLEKMRAERQAALDAFFLGMKAAAEDAPDADALVPMLKVEVSSRSSWLVREAQLFIGGHGILDDFSPLNRLADDAVVNEIWEGTHPILAGHAAKALRRPRALAAFLARLEPAAAAELKARVEASRAWSEDEKNAGDEALVSAAYRALTRTSRSYHPPVAFDPKQWTQEAAATWSEAAERYDALSSRLFGPTAEAFVEFAGLRKGWKALELACGPGLASRAAAKRLGEKGALLATDLAPGMIARAQAAAPVKRGAPITWQLMDAQALDLPDASFDAAFSQLGLMLFAEPDRALREMARVVVPGGPVSCLVQGRADRMELTALLLMTMVQKAPELKAPQDAPTLFAFGKEGVIEAAFAKAGLVEIVVRRLAGTYRFASSEEYWVTMTEGAGKTGAMLRSLSHEKQFFVKKEVIRKANRFRKGKNLEIPYEFVMARGCSPTRKVK